MGRKMTLTALPLMAIALVATFALAGCAQPGGASPEPTDDEPVVIVEGTPLLYFDAGDGDGSKLVEDMDAGRTPVSCTVLYDQMGGRPEVVVTDPETIAKIYDLVSHVIVLEESNLGITDSYHHISFELADGTVVNYSFEGESLLSVGIENYGVTGTDELWSFVRELQDAQAGSGQAHAIEVASGADLLRSWPHEAKAGETVVLECTFITDGELVITVNGEGGGSFSSDRGEYSFEMPDEDARIEVSVSTEGYTGA